MSVRLELRVDPALLEALDEDRARQPYPVARSAQIAALLWWALEHKPTGRRQDADVDVGKEAKK